MSEPYAPGKPITPVQTFELKKSSVPSAVIDIWNARILKEYTVRTRSAIVLRSAITGDLMSATGCTDSEVVEQGWLDIESLFEDHGWKVRYDKPAYNENYPAKFIFTVRTSNVV